MRSVVPAGSALLAVTAMVAASAAAFTPVASAHTRAAHAIPAGFQDWIEHNHDAQHTGVSAETILSASTSYQLHWAVNTGNATAYSSPAVAYNTTLGESVVYVGNQGGLLNAYNAATGTLVWSYQVAKTAGLSKEIESSPAVSNNTVYFGDGDWHEYALNATTGALVCRSQSLGGISASSPVIGNPDGNGDVVYFGDNGPNGDVNIQDGGHLWAIYGAGNTDGPACGTKWSYDNFGSPPGSQTGLAGVYSSPAYGTLSGGTPVVVVGSTDNDDAIYEVNANTGVSLWRFQTLVGFDADVGAPATIAEPGTVGVSGSQTFTDGVVYDTGKDAHTYGIDLQTGAQLWDFSIKPTIGHGNPSQSGAAIVGNFLYIGYGAGVFSLDARTGTLNPSWTSGATIGTTALTTGVVSSPAISGPPGNQVILAGDIGGDVLVFNLQTGVTEFMYPTGQLFFSSAAVSTGQFFISNGGNGDLYAFGAASGFPSPSVTAVSPNHGAVAASSPVTITGNAFSGSGFTTSDVIFRQTDIPATNAYPCVGSAGGCFTIISPTEIRAFTPTTLPAGTVDITVVTPAGTSLMTAADDYTYVAPGAYTAISPFRICDTRPAGHGITANQCDAAGKGTLVPGRETINVQITGAHVPSGAQAVVANISAIDHGSASTFITAFPAGGSQPLASNISLAGGAVEANLSIVQLSSGGQINLFNSVGSADVIVDVVGYFSTAAGGPAGAFHTIAPLRICDSRALAGNTTICAHATGSNSAPLIGGTWRHVVLSGVPPGTSISVPHIPTDGTAAAAVFNLTGTGGTAPTFLSVAPPSGSDACPTGAPAFSNLNPTPGISLGNRVISNLGPNQDICLFSSAGSINFVIDVNGWFGRATAPAGAFFYSVAPTRVCDTRTGPGTECDGQSLTPLDTLQVGMAGVLVVPAEGGSTQPLAVVANLTAVAGTAATYFTLYPSDAAKPKASDINVSADEVLANLAITGLATTGPDSGSVALFNAAGDIDAVLDVAGWFQ